MNLRRIAVALLIVAIMVATLGCALTNLLGFGGDSDPVAEVSDPVAEATDPVAEAGDPVAEATAVSSSAGELSAPSGGQATPPDGESSAPVASLDAFTSYRVESEMSTLQDDTSTESLYVLVEYTAEPRASRMVMGSSEGGLLGGETEIIQVGGTMYMRTGDEWLAVSGSAFDNELIHTAYLGAQDVPSPSECQNRGRETVNGYETVRYECEANHMLGGASTLGLFSGTGWQGTYEYWLSTAHDVPVRIQYEATYTDAEGKPSTIRMLSNTTMINEPIAIEPPEGVSAAGLPDDIPLIEGATDVTSFMSITTFEVAMAPAEVVSWYEEALEAAGWTHDADSSWGEMLQFTKGGRSVILSVSETSGGSEVTIMGGDEE